MKAWVIRYMLLAFLSLFSSAKGDSRQQRAANGKDVQDVLNSLSASMENLEKKVDKDIRSKIIALTDEVQRLKAENRKILESQKDFEAQLLLISPRAFVHRMVTSPKARLYRKTNFRGDFEDYAFDTASFIGGCHTLKKLENNVTSVETFGKCLRLFADTWCDDRSVAVYPGSGNAQNILKANMTKVGSIGPCPPEEFAVFDFKDATKQTVVKNSSNPRSYFPDLVQFYSNEKYRKATSLSGSSFSLAEYLLGPRNRLEFLQADIFPKHLNISQPEFQMQNTSTFRALENEPGDTVGYGILPSLGGPVNETYNAFPQTITSQLRWTTLTNEIRPFLQSGGERVRVCLNFAYEDGDQSRPTGFYFWIGYFRTDSPQKVSYGRVEN